MTVITTADVTTGALDGTGVFDKLMDTLSVHLTSEFNQGRISGGDYAKVYSASLQTTIQQAINFTLSKQEADAQAEILKAQKELLDIQIIGAGLDNTIKTKQATKLDSDIALTNQQLAIALVQETNLGKEGLQIDATILDIQQKTDIGAEQELNLAAERLNIPKMGEKIDADVLKNTSEIALIDQNQLNAVTVGNNLTTQGTKIQAEVNLLGQKKATEDAQTLDTAHVNSVVGKQISLYGKQTDGFDRDSEQKAAKLFVDTWNVRRSTKEDTVTTSTGLQDNNIELVLEKLMSGITLTQLKSP